MPDITFFYRKSIESVLLKVYLNVYIIEEKKLDAKHLHGDMTMIEVENVSRQFGTFKAVDNISFSIQTGEIVGLLGPNGAGKTTTMRMITGFLEPSGGKISVEGKIGYMPESAPLYSDMIVADYLEYIAKMEGADPKVRIPHLAEVCGLKDQMHKNIGDLSRGNRQRVGLAHALMGDPEILILDEPTSGLDPNQVAQVRDLIKEIGKTRTVIISTHILSEVEMLCNRVIIISKGKKVADSPTEELRERYGQSTCISISVSGPSQKELEQALSSIEGISSCKIKEDEGSRFSASIFLQKEIEIRPQVANVIVSKKWNLYSLDMAKNSLEDVFRTLTSKDTNGDNNNDQ